MSKIEYNDVIGKTFGFLTIKKITKSDGRYKQAICKCSCGNTKEIALTYVLRNIYVSCGNCYNGISYESFIGKKYGHLTVVNVEKHRAVCKCDCGNTIKIRISLVTRNNNTTCGQCYNGVPYKNFIGKRYGTFTIESVYSGPGYKTAICKCVCGNIKKIHLSVLSRKHNLACENCYNGVPYKNFIGKRYGTFKILNIKKSSKRTMIVCKCDCGIIKEVRIGAVKNLKIRCGNCHNGIPYKNYIGKTFGYLTITNIHTEKTGKYASCTCQCGNETKQPFSSLVNNKVLSCGCLKSKIGALKKISFGSLNIVETSNNNIGGLRYICKCSCGNEVEVLESDLFTGKVTCCKECLDLK